MCKRKSLFALLIIGVVILGVISVSNYGSAEQLPLIIEKTNFHESWPVGVPYLGSLKVSPRGGGVFLPKWSVSSADTISDFGLKYKMAGADQELMIVGTPTKEGKANVVVYVDASNYAQAYGNFSIEITPNTLPINQNDLAIDFSGLKAGMAGRPYSGIIKANNAAKRPFWKLGTNNLSDFGLTAPESSYGSSFTIRSINSKSAKEGTATGTITLFSRIGQNETDEISGEFKIEIKKSGGGNGVIAPKISSFKVNGARSAKKVTEGDEITFSWNVPNATSMEIKGRLTPQSAEDPAGQKNICEENSEGCKLPAGKLKVKISKSSAFSLRATNTQDGKSKTTTSSVYVIVKPVKKKVGTLVVESKLDNKLYTGRIVPVIDGKEQSGKDVWRFFKDGKEDNQGNLNINSVPKVFNRTIGKWELKVDSSVEGFRLFSPTGKKISASLQSISPNGGELKSGGTIRFGLNFKISDDNGGGGLTITTASLADATVGAAYGQSLSAIGGTAPYAWSIISGKLPAGLTLNSAGLLSGTPTKADSKTFKIQVQDSSSPKKSKVQQFALTVKNTGTEVKYSCNSQGSCVEDPTGSYSDPMCGNACSSNTSTTPDLNQAYKILQNIEKEQQILCSDWKFLDLAVEKLNNANARWGYHKYPETKKKLSVSQDRIAWYNGTGVPQNGSGEVIAFDIIQDYKCKDHVAPILRKPKVVPYENDQWSYPRSNQKSSVVETPELAELEIGTVTPILNLALVEDVAAPNKSLIAQGLDAMDSISLPVQFYTEKFFRDALSASFWKKVKKSLEFKKAPKRKLKSTPSPTK
ncbi:MAG: hypothetical protein A2736_01430 [Candidatus Yanofskybacteria bacterium RIFCSPHIGHO2_01_FULL_41_27]|uniref:Uncharacterized protein n=4 Tax=Parcubacteria group TaxID=1794811 RepID=A0A1F8HVD9_9BACT|nr:MAG: S-layer domain protein [Candidatus Jorgensenbacteria bacterium GW2011_GWF2_41_8]OGM99458.1 MAG: hypothetical protein A2736_01430 [Candidatus Yanofskybacteria bacterium RIFCSPHIGHO2_01_FULL_41_27]OGN09131.1 MAG: hypothetical protein A3C64_02820 [Candidatus Yanofskybacteria bacterium RIFCSPHIGHO2_02_FULL_41_12]OGN20167.1 MAG: hypothetical protein A3B00_02495 [Candidatus Yanofskybacteria bacterium RIFCSPLOWO2_01_FULL_41_33]OGN41521.1 MAG: hypothetical protein A2606_04080 [Candidatus Yanofs